MRRLLLFLPMLLLAACEPAEPTAAQVAEKLQAQINELLEEVDKSLEEVGDLDLAGLCTNSGKINAGMDTNKLRSLCPALPCRTRPTSTRTHYSFNKLRSHAAQWFSKRRQESFSHTFSHEIRSSQSADDTLAHNTRK